MRSQGSVLIVVLGLLAILAIVGVTFVTMSSMDRSTASNFALQSQFMLAADGAIDYVCDHLVKDLWQYNPQAWRGGLTDESDDPYGDLTPPLLTDLKTIPNPRASGTSVTLSRLEARYAFIRNEPWDYPGPEDPWLGTTLDWPTLTALAGASGQAPPDQPDFQYSYGTTLNTNAYGLQGRWGAAASVATDVTNRANNLGIPGGDAETRSIAFTPWQRAVHVDPHWPPSGVWIPELSFPYETGLIRVSVTVQDHGALVNVNAHGNPESGTGPLADVTRRGYFISDITPVKQTLGLDVLNVFLARSPGGRPGNYHSMKTEIENPALGATPPPATYDRPFTLDEEFELRRYTGTSYRSRLEKLAYDAGSITFEMDPAQIMSRSPPTELGIQKRLSLTTIGWTSEVRPDPWVTFDPGDPTRALLHPTNSGLVNAGYVGRKADVNLDPPQYVLRALWYGRVFNHAPPTSTLVAQYKQFCANIAGFRDGQDRLGIRDYETLIRISDVPAYDPSPTPIYAASRQPIISKLKSTQESDTRYRVDVELFSPWEGNCVGDTKGLSLQGFQLVPYAAAGGGIGEQPTALPARMPVEVVGSGPGKNCLLRSFTVNVPVGGRLTEGLRMIKLSYGNIDVDQVDNTKYGDTLTKLDTVGSLYRPIYVAWKKEHFGADERAPDVRVVYIGDWTQAQSGTQIMGEWTQPAAPPQPMIPIRFPRSCRTSTTDIPLIPDSPYKGLPPKPTSTAGDPATASGEGTFRAVPRLGDLNQVLWPNPNVDPNFWPWVPRVAYGKTVAGAALTNKDVKFTWEEPTGVTTESDQARYSLATTFSRLFAANVLCVGGPWGDGIDNDGDGATDDRRPAGLTVDTGETTGRFGGPEIRVAGKINLNTATPAALEALETGVRLTARSLQTGVAAVRKKKPCPRFLTPAFVLEDQLPGVHRPLDSRRRTLRSLRSRRAAPGGFQPHLQHGVRAQRHLLHLRHGAVRRRLRLSPQGGQRHPRAVRSPDAAILGPGRPLAQHCLLARERAHREPLLHPPAHPELPVDGLERQPYVRRAVGLRTCLASYQVAGWHGHALLRGRAWSRRGQARSRNGA